MNTIVRTVTLLMILLISSSCLQGDKIPVSSSTQESQKEQPLTALQKFENNNINLSLTLEDPNSVTPPLAVNIKFDKDVVDFNYQKIQLRNATLNDFVALSKSSFRIFITPTSETTVEIFIQSLTVHDDEQNTNAHSGQLSFLFDLAPPSPPGAVTIPQQRYDSSGRFIASWAPSPSATNEDIYYIVKACSQTDCLNGCVVEQKTTATQAFIELPLSAQLQEYYICVEAVDQAEKRSPAPISTSITSMLYIPTNVLPTLWLRANGEQIKDDQNLVSNWKDESGHGNDFLQSSSTARPTYKTNSINSHPSIQFDGRNDFLSSSKIASDTLTKDNFTSYILFEAYLVSSNAVSPELSNGIWQIKNSNLGLYLLNDKVHAYNYSGQLPADILSKDIAISQYLFIKARHLDGKLYLSLNGGPEIESTSDATNSLSDIIELGRSSSMSDQYFAGEIVELLFFDQEVIVPDELLIYNYLSQKYNINLTGQSTTIGDNAFTKSFPLISSNPPLIQGTQATIDLAINHPDNLSITSLNCTVETVGLPQLDPNFIPANTQCDNLSSLRTFLNTTIRSKVIFSYSISPLPPTATLIWTPTYTQRGAYKFTITTSDGTNNYSAETLVVVRENYPITNLDLYYDALYATKVTDFAYPGMPQPVATDNSPWLNLTSLSNSVSLLNFLGTNWVGNGQYNGPYALNFDGADDQVNLGTSLGANENFAISFWLKPTDLTATAEGTQMVTNGGISGNGIAIGQSKSNPERVFYGIGSKNYESTIMADNPAAYWKLDESSGTIITDVTTNYPATAQVGVTVGQPTGILNDNNTLPGRSASFNGVNTNGYILTDANFAPINSTVTLEAWFQVDASSIGTTFNIIGSCIDINSECTGLDYEAIFLRVQSDQKIVIGFGSDWATRSIIATSNSAVILIPNKWHHIAGTINTVTNSAALYFDGQPFSSSSNIIGGPGADIITPRFAIGGMYHPLSGKGLDPHTGLIDEVVVYQSVLTPTQILNHYNAGAGCISSGLLKSNQFNLVTVAHDEGNNLSKLYLNGRLECQTTNDIPLPSGDTSFYLSGTGTQSWEGELANLKLYKHSSSIPITDAEVRQIYTSTANRFREFPLELYHKSALVFHFDAANAYGGTSFPGIASNANCSDLQTDIEDVSPSTEDHSASFIGFDITNNDCTDSGNTGWQGNGTSLDPYNLSFDGADDEVQFLSQSDLQLTDQFTIEMWVRCDDTVTSQYLLSKANNYAIICGTQAGYVNFYNLGYQPDATTTRIPITTSEWTHIVYTKDANGEQNNWRAYKNGVEQFNIQRDFTLVTGNNPLRLANSGAVDFAQAAIAVVRLYNEGLSENQIRQNCMAEELRFTSFTTGICASPLTIELTSTTDTNAPYDDTIHFTATFPTDVEGFTESDLIVTGGTLSNFIQVSGSEYTFEIDPSSSAALNISIPAGAATEEGGTLVSSAANVTYPHIDITAPSGDRFFPNLNGGPIPQSDLLSSGNEYRIDFNFSISGSGPIRLSCQYETVGLLSNHPHYAAPGTPCSNLEDKYYLDSVSGFPSVVNFSYDLSSGTGFFHWVTIYDQKGTYKFTISITDGINTDNKVRYVTISDSTYYFPATMLGNFDSSFSAYDPLYPKAPQTIGSDLQDWPNLSVYSGDATLVNFDSSSHWWSTSAPYYLKFDGVDDYLDLGINFNTGDSFSISTWISSDQALTGNGRTLLSNGTSNSNLSGISLRESRAVPGTFEIGLGQKGWEDYVKELGPVAHWRLNESGGTKMTDSVSNHHGTAGPLVVPGAGDTQLAQSTGKYAFFSGDTPSNSKVTVPYSPELNPMSFTIEAWARWDGEASDWGSVVTSRDSIGGDFDGYILYKFFGASAPWQFWIGSGSNWSVRQSSANAVANKWTHLVGTYDSSTLLMKFYVDGLLNSSGSSTFDPNRISDLQIGSGHDTGNQFSFDGDIDEVVLYDRALSSDEILQLYQRGRACRTQLPIDNRFYQVTTTFNNTSNDLKIYLNGKEECLLENEYFEPTGNENLLFGQNPEDGNSWEGRLANIKVYNGALTSNNVYRNFIASSNKYRETPIEYNHNLYTLLFYADPANSFHGLHFPGEGCSTLTFDELSESRQRGVLKNFSPCNVNIGWRGTGASGDPYRLSFDGTSNLHVNFSDTQLQGTGNFTVEAWFKTSTTGTRREIIAIGDEDTINQGLKFYVNFDEKLRVDTSGVPGTSTASSVDDNLWHHGVVTYDGTNTQLYLDGFADGASTAALAPNIDNSSGEGIVIGDTIPPASNAFEYIGDIGPIKIYNQQSDLTTIKVHYHNQANRFRDHPVARIPNKNLYIHFDPANSQSGTGFPGIALNDCSDLKTNARNLSPLNDTVAKDGTLENFISCSTYGWQGTGVPSDPYRITMDGTNNVGVSYSNTEIPDINTTYLLTITAWIRTSVLKNHMVLGKHTSGTGGSFYFGYRNPNLITFVRIDSAPVRTDLDVSYPGFNDGQWHFLAATSATTASGTTVKIYADGKLIHTDSQASTLPFRNQGDNFYIGNYSGGVWGLNGDIGELLMYYDDLNEDEILAICRAQKDRYSGAVCSP